VVNKHVIRVMANRSAGLRPNQSAEDDLVAHGSVASGSVIQRSSDDIRRGCVREAWRFIRRVAEEAWRNSR
jgi:hypothetical protein